MILRAIRKMRLSVRISRLDLKGCSPLYRRFRLCGVLGLQKPYEL
ncbi:hypothetical protein CAMGR0001_1399 [Campylobacter gracilis RM3268]|uniref:Uncharacterized protein n=1 Tax=Campylobacter gracilis RM3268 TaxID=553220 RepID=C8PJJ9_9BACT|nr:hypothetical protein CAMGR0001_1399 [Campylobacter gracilis RM3268]